MRLERVATWEELMRAANRGDALAYRELLRAITPVLRGIVRARGTVLGPEGCEDIVQEVLLAVHLKRHTWREDAPLRPWLYAIARHKVADAFRARGARVDLPIEDFADLLRAADEPDPLLSHDLDRVLGALEPRAADIVRGFGIRGETVAETAERLQMSEGAVRVALHRALKSIARLRERMME
ncbi:sigma-70 family RNA polymerase sigma factor [Halovulum dunhuangense]|uniref:Sigma-70 family RNA polymerase sigma factor n=1 Tax=Halovulum dunhuangense TaxID=1505036 RepID=A0A849L6D2_9RHOB|nr:sigma-70 family RNA polymerase sigma factor [Halovulum dunhuangense]NNU81803.1 sigma-70 family RNA polymerase sigma factor [Halovulum dunhuangense]